MCMYVPKNTSEMFITRASDSLWVEGPYCSSSSFLPAVLSSSLLISSPCLVVFSLVAPNLFGVYMVLPFYLIEPVFIIFHV